MRRPVIVFLTVLFGVLGGFLVFPATVGIAGAAVDTGAAEQSFVDAINGVRAAKGLVQLTVHPELVDVARGWASKMSAADEISHNPRLADAVRADWQKLGENVGVGTTVDQLHAAFVASPLHYKNIVDPAFTHVGVGVVLGRDGAMFTAHQFMTLRPEAAREAEKPAVAREAEKKITAVPARLGSPSARLVLVLQQLRALDA